MPVRTPPPKTFEIGLVMAGAASAGPTRRGLSTFCWKRCRLGKKRRHPAIQAYPITTSAFVSPPEPRRVASSPPCWR
jgi:hypothetical protein